MQPDTQKMVIMGNIVAAHGVRGQMKVKIFCERAQDLTAYGPLSLEDGTALTLQIKSFNKGLAICSAASVSNRDGAEALTGSALYLERDKLPELDEGQIYQVDLLGMQVCNSDGTLLGVVVGLHDFGAGEIVEIQLAEHNRTEMLPYYPPFLKQVDIKARQIILDVQDANKTEKGIKEPQK